MSMNNKLHLIFREFLSIKLKISSSLKFIIIDTNQDDIKSFEQLNFFEKLNVECDLRANKLITSTPSDEIIPFPLELNSAHMTNSGNQLILNHIPEITTHAHLIIYKDYLKN